MAENVFGGETEVPDWVNERPEGQGADWATSEGMTNIDEGDEPTTNLDDAEEPVTNIDDEEAPSAETPAETPAAATEAPASSEADEGAVQAPAVQAEQSVEIDWQKRYGDLFRLRQADGDRYRELEQQNQKLTQAMSKVVPILQQLARKPPSDDELTQAGIDPDIYKAATPIIEREVAQRTQAIEQRFASEAEARAYQEAQRAEQQYLGEVAVTVDGFMKSKGITEGSALDSGVGSFLQQLAAVSDQRGLDPLDLRDSSLLDLALEAAQSPYLRAQLLANPEWVEDDELVGLARKQAAILNGVQPAATTQSDAVQSEPLPHVVRGGGNPKKGSPREFDPLADAKALAAEESGIF